MFVMDSEFKYGKMAPNTKVNGKTIKRTARESSGTPMEIFTRVNSRTTSRTALEFSTAQTGRFMRVYGLMTFSTVKVKQIGPTAQVTLEIIRKEEEMGLGLTSGQTATVIVVNGLITRCVVLELTSGQTVENMKDIARVLFV